MTFDDVISTVVNRILVQIRSWSRKERKINLDRKNVWQKQLMWGILPAWFLNFRN